ncbi:MAG: hypothetical protein WCY05_05200 [Candidatus Omnitrophota bacterium]
MIKPCADCEKSTKKGCCCSRWSKWYNEQLELDFPVTPILNFKKKKMDFNYQIAKPKTYRLPISGEGHFIAGTGNKKRKEL